MHVMYLMVWKELDAEGERRMELSGIEARARGRKLGAKVREGKRGT